MSFFLKAADYALPKLTFKLSIVDCSVGDRDEDLRVPPSPGTHSGWNKFKQANPNDFYTPNKRRQSGGNVVS